MQQKCDKYTTRLTLLAKNCSTKIYISSFFISQYSIEIKTNRIRYLNWNINKLIESIDVSLSIEIWKNCRKDRKYSIQRHRIINKIKDIINYVHTIDLLY